MKQLSQWWNKIQGYLFSWLEEELDSLTEKQQQLISTLEIIRLEDFIKITFKSHGRPLKDRIAIASAFIAKAIYNMPTTRVLLDRLKSDIVLRRICGWESKNSIPDESTFSRAFKEFSELKLPELVHNILIKKMYRNKIIGHISRDSTAIKGREKPKKSIFKKESQKINKEKEPSRIEKQKHMTLEEMLCDLPKKCDVGTKKNSKGYKESWIGYKFHIDSGDGQIPISCILTSASIHDSQAAIPLAAMSNNKALNLYDLMDAAYDVDDIKKYSKFLKHVPIIDINPRRNLNLKNEIEEENKRQKIINFKPPDKIRYNERTTVERVNSQLKDAFGGRMIRVKGHAKVFCHLMFGILALTVNQMLTFAK